MTAPRYAIYLAPDPETRLWRFGSSMLGYDADTGRGEPVPEALAGLGLDWRAATEAPRRYGFHGTLKAPFRLADGRSEDDLLVAAERLAATHDACAVPRLEPRALGRFVALTLAEPHAALHALADDCVRGLDALRAPLTDAERARRGAAALPPRQAAYLERWGYPHVLDEFRFHMTLTGPLPDEQRPAVLERLRALHAPLDAPVAVDAVAVFVQPSPEARFRVLRRLPLRSG